MSGFFTQTTTEPSAPVESTTEIPNQQSPDTPYAPALDLLQDLHVKYRPQSFDEVLGQDSVVHSLKSVLHRHGGAPHVFILTGPSGCGKTTLLRIIAREIGIEPEGITETDAATNSGVEAMRELTDGLRYKGFGKSGKKFIIIDECHMLSRGAWNATLKIIEEPPPHVYFGFATTEPDKIIETVKTRAHMYTLRNVPDNDLYDLLVAVNQIEEFNLSTEWLWSIATGSKGSPRQALVYLSQATGCVTNEDLQKILQTSLEDNKQITDLCKLLINGQLTWTTVCNTVKKFDDQSPESVRLGIVGYLTKVILNDPNENRSVDLLNKLQAFSGTYNANEKWAPLLLSFGRALYS